MISKPYIGITHHNAYLGFSIANRVLVMIFMAYTFTYQKVGDLLILPLAAIGTGFIILLIRLIRSHCFQSCLNKIRS